MRSENRKQKENRKGGVRARREVTCSWRSGGRSPPRRAGTYHALGLTGARSLEKDWRFQPSSLKVAPTSPNASQPWTLTSCRRRPACFVIENHGRDARAVVCERLQRPRRAGTSRSRPGTPPAPPFSMSHPVYYGRRLLGPGFPD
jgi:hypothetical protein